MPNNHIVFDEVNFWERPFQSEPTPSMLMEGYAILTPPSTRVDLIQGEERRKLQERRKIADRRRAERENCLHGQTLFPIRWSPGVQPTGERIFYVNVDYLKGGPYLLSEEQHQVLHREGHGHEHVSEGFKR